MEGEIFKCKGKAYKKVIPKKESNDSSYFQHTTIVSSCRGCAVQYGSEVCLWAGDCTDTILQVHRSWLETFKQL